MAITHLLAPIPKWIIIGNDGLTAGGAKLYTKRSINKTQNKTVYQDAAGVIPWTNPIIFDANGAQGAFYWTVDPNDLNETYYLEVYDSNNNLLWTLDDYLPPGSGSGGGTTTTYVGIKNYLINNLFWRYFSSDFFVSASTNTIIAPGAHSSLPEVSTSTNGATGSDIRFIKSNTTSTDRIRFTNFNQGDDPFVDDVTPAWSLQFTCSAAGSETYKYIQFPICPNVNSIDNQTMTFVCWAKVQSTPTTINVGFRQFYGSSGGGADTFSSAAPMDLTTSWQRFVKTIVIPTANGAIGACGNDALYLRILLPTGVTDLYIAKPQLYLGNISPDAEFDTFDDIDSVLNVPRTSDLQISVRRTAPLGWIAMNDGTIGDASSGADRNNIDTFPLFRELYIDVDDTYAPVSGGRTAPGNDITSCIVDYAAHKRISLTKALGRALCGYGSGSGLTPRVLGEYLGEEKVTLVANELPVTSYGWKTNSTTVNTGGGTTIAIGDPAQAANTAYISNPGGGQPHNNMPPSAFYSVFIKL